MGIFDRFTRRKPPKADTSAGVKPPEELADLESIGEELLRYTRGHSNELIVVVGGNAVANFYEPSAWKDGTRGQELARRYQDRQKEENVRENPGQFFTDDVEMLAEELKKNRLEFLDWKGMTDSEMSDEVMNYLDTVLREVRQKNEQLRSLTKSLEDIKQGGLALSEGVRNEAKRMLRDLKTYKDQDYDFGIFLANPRIKKILEEKGEKADLSVQKNTSDLRKEYLELHKATKALSALIN